MMRKKNFFALTCIILCVWVSTLLALPVQHIVVNNGINEEKKVLLDSVDVAEIISPRDSIKKKLIEEVEGYIYKGFPKTNKTIPQSIVEKGLENNVDIIFMMAQTQIETSFGLAGAGRETSRRSLFGVALRKYGSYDEAIGDYVDILKKKYLVNGKTEKHLMNNYVTKGGSRYAGNPKYEVELRSAYNRIRSKTKIKTLQTEYFKCYKEKGA